jgi:hypothetical protein
MKVLYGLKDEAIDFASARISFDGITLNERGESRFLPLRSFVETRGTFDFQKFFLAVPSVHAVLGNIAELKGELHANFQGSKEFALKVKDLRAEPQSMTPLLPGTLQRRLSRFAFTGSVSATGIFEGNIGQDLRNWHCDLVARLQENELAFTESPISFKTRMTGEIRGTGTLSRPQALLAANCVDSLLQTGNVQFERGAMQVTLSGTYPVLDLKTLNIHVPSANLQVGGMKRTLERIEGNASSGNINLERNALQLPELTLATSVLKNITVSAEITEEQLFAVLDGKDVHLLEFVQALELVPEGWKTGSNDSLHVQATLGKDGNLTLTSEVGIDALSFESPDGRCLGEYFSFILEP